MLFAVYFRQWARYDQTREKAKKRKLSTSSIEIYRNRTKIEMLTKKGSIGKQLAFRQISLPFARRPVCQFGRDTVSKTCEKYMTKLRGADQHLPHLQTDRGPLVLCGASEGLAYPLAGAAGHYGMLEETGASLSEPRPQSCRMANLFFLQNASGNRVHKVPLFGTEL